MPHNDVISSDVEFRKRIAALCLQPNWLPRYRFNVLKSEFFDAEYEQYVVEFILRFWEKYKRPPDVDEALSEFLNDPEAYTFAQDIFYVAKNEELDYAADMAIQFAQEQAAKLATLANMDDIEKGILSKLVPRMEQVLEIGRDFGNLGISIRDTQAYLDFDEDEKILTGMYHLDNALEGGIGRGEYLIALGGTNVGKTQFLINVGAGAASIAQGANVTHITLEMNEKKVARRYAARMVGHFYTKNTELDDYEAEFEHMSSVRLRGNIQVKGWPSGTATIEDIDNYLDLLEVEGYKTDLLIVDYADIMKHKQIGEYRHNLSNTTVEFRAMADERNIAIASASQTNRGGLNAEIVDLNDIAEDIGKVNNADIVIGLCQTKLEYDADEMRLFGAKVRDSKRNWIVPCSLYPDSHAIITNGLMQLSDYVAMRKKDDKGQPVSDEEIISEVHSALAKARGKK